MYAVSFLKDSRNSWLTGITHLGVVTLQWPIINVMMYKQLLLDFMKCHCLPGKQIISSAPMNFQNQNVYIRDYHKFLRVCFKSHTAT